MANLAQKDVERGVHEIGGLKNARVQTFRGVAGDYVTDDDLFSEKYIQYELAQIKLYLEDPLVHFLYIVAGLIGSTLNAMAQPGANMLRLEGSVLQEVRQFAPDAMRDLELTQMHATNKRLKALIGEPEAGPAAPPTTVSAPPSGETEALRNAILSITPMDKIEFTGDAYKATDALVKIFKLIVEGLGKVYDATGQEIPQGNDDEMMNNMRKLGTLYTVEARSIRKKEKTTFTPVSGRYHLVWDAIIKRNLFPAITQRDVFVNLYGGPVQDAIKEVSESAAKQVPNPVLSVPANVPPARAAQLGLGEPMNKLTYAEALKWLLENKSSPTETDMAIIRQLFAPKPANHPDWQLMPHHSKHVFLAPNVAAAIMSCEESVKEHIPINSHTLIEDPVLKVPFATLVAAFIQWKQTGTSSFTSIHSSQILFNEYHRALDKFARLRQVGTSYEFAPPAPPPESRAMRMMRMYGGVA